MSDPNVPNATTKRAIRLIDVGREASLAIKVRSSSWASINCEPFWPKLPPRDCDPNVKARSDVACTKAGGILSWHAIRETAKVSVVADAAGTPL